MLHQGYIRLSQFIHQNPLLTLVKNRRKAGKNSVLGSLLIIMQLAFIHNSIAQNLNLGCPPIENYNMAQYRAGNQNWAALSHEGRMYFANSGGLLVHDGVKWNTFTTPNNTIVRSIATDNHQKICIGAQGELGCFEPNDKGELIYSSLLDDISPTISDIEDVWQLEFIDSTLYAHIKANELLIYLDGNAQIISTNSPITDMVKLENEIFIHVAKEGIYKLINGVPKLIKGTEPIKDYEVVDLLAYGKGMLVITINHGLFYYEGEQMVKWDSNADNYISINQARCGLLIDNDQLLVGTHLGGIVRIGKDKKADLIIDKKHGLKSNAINAMSLTLDGSLWVATSSGLDKIDLESSYEAFYPDGDLEGAVYDIKFWNDRIYFCTSNGVYSIEEKNYYNPFREREFMLVVGSKGQAYNLDLINDELFCGHHNGAFKITKSNKFEPILEDIGAWKFISLNETTIALGTYEGVYVLKKTPTNRWIVQHKVSGLNESSRVMLLDDLEQLWISHPYKNVYRIDFNENFTSSSLRKYDKEDGFQSNNRNYIFPYQGKCFLTNNTGVYQYNEDSDNFVTASKFAKLYPGGLHVRNILESSFGTWIISDVGTDRLTINENNPESFNVQIVIPGKTDEHYIGGFENLFPLDSNSLLICSEKGVKLFKSDEPLSNISPAPMITSVSLPEHRDSIIYGGYGDYSEFILDENIHNINFEFTSPKALKPIQFYRYKLEGYEEDWSDWTSNQSKQYSNLDYGEYIFHVRSVNRDNSESPATKVAFSINTPWHQTSIAFIIYGLIFLLGFLGLLLIPRQKYKQNTAILTAEKQKTEDDLVKVKEQTDRDLENIRREKLESEIAFKNKELALSTMYLLQKNETLNAIRSEVENIETSIVDHKAKR